MQAIILAGGFGTRLKHILPDVPKPMAEINGAPFLALLIRHLRNEGFSSFVLCVHHMREKIIDYFSNDNSIKFAIEESPLGTGGAIANAIRQFGLKGNISAMNGDSFLALDYRAFCTAHNGNKFSIALCEVEDTARYGRIEVSEKIVKSFKEKGISGRGLINTGSYFIDSDWFMNYLKDHKIPTAFSIENNFLLPHINKIQAGYYITKGYFIDIGIPEDYARAQEELIVRGSEG